MRGNVNNRIVIWFWRCLNWWDLSEDRSFFYSQKGEIILKEYCLRVDNGTVNYDVSTLSVSIPATIKNSVDGMKLETYNKMIGYLK